MQSGREPIGIIGAMDSELSLLLASMQQSSQEVLYGINFHTGIKEYQIYPVRIRHWPFSNSRALLILTFL